MKLAILGGGGFRVPLVYRALLRDTGSPRVDDVALYDVDADRLAVMAGVLAQQASGYADPPRVTTTTELDKALEGADFCFSAIRVGGLQGRTRDERVALDLGVLGQETTGPGGLAYGLRTLPVALHIAERIRAVAPSAYLINFTNPAGMITEALQSVLGDRVVGICDTPGALVERAVSALGLERAKVRAEYVGLNHLGWLRGLMVEGRDRLPELLADEKALGGLEEGEIFGADWLQTLGAIPNEYLYYYYFNRDAVRSIVERPETRGEFLVGQQGDFYAAAAREPERAWRLWCRTIAEREALYMAEAKGSEPAAGIPEDEPEEPVEPVEPVEPAESAAGYEKVALAVMAAIARDERATMILNVRGGGVVAGLDPDAVVEVPALVDGSGVRALSAAVPDQHQLGLMQQIKAGERLIIEAARTGSPDTTLRAFALHPLVDSVSVARELVRGYGLVG